MTAEKSLLGKAREDLQRDYEELFALPSGAFVRVLKRIIQACGTYVTVLPGPGEPGNQIYVNAGRQELGLDLVKEILALAPSQWEQFYRREIKDLMLKEKG